MLLDTLFTRFGCLDVRNRTDEHLHFLVRLKPTQKSGSTGESYLTLMRLTAVLLHS